MREGLGSALRRKGFRSCRCQHWDGVTVSVTLATTWTLISIFIWLRALFSATSILHLLTTSPPGEAETTGLPNISPHARVYAPAPCRPITCPGTCGLVAQPQGSCLCAHPVVPSAWLGPPFLALQGKNYGRERKKQPLRGVLLSRG